MLGVTLKPDTEIRHHLILFYFSIDIAILSRLRGFRNLIVMRDCENDSVRSAGFIIAGELAGAQIIRR